MAATVGTPPFLLLILIAFSETTLSGSENSTVSEKTLTASPGFEDHETFTEPTFPTGQGAFSPNSSCNQTLMENDFDSYTREFTECLNSTAENNSLSTNATSTSPTSGNALQRVSIINTGQWSSEIFESLVKITDYCTIPIVLVGSLLNVFCVAVYLQPAMRSSSSTYLAALSLAELLYLLANVPIIVLDITKGNDARKELVPLIILFVIGLYMTTVTRRTAFTLTLIVCFERLLAIAFPLKYRQMRLSSHPARVSIVCALSVVIPHIYLLIKYEFVPTGNGDYTSKVRSFYVDIDAQMSVFATVLRIVFVYVTLVGTLVVNVLTTVVMRRHRKASKHLTTNRDATKDDKAERQTTLAILVSSFLFVLLSLPSSINSVINNFLPDYGYLKKEHYLFLSIDFLTRFLENVSSSIDFISYMILSKRFRVTFIKMFRGKAANVTQNTETTQQSEVDSHTKA